MSICRSVGEFLDNYFKNGEGFKQLIFEDKTLYKSLFQVAMNNKNDKDYQFLLGDIHSTYVSGYQDPKLSFEFYVKAANQNHPKAMYSVGLCYFNGKGVIKDYVRSIYWFNKALSLGYNDALIYIGLCYFKGLGVEINYTKAFELFETATKYNLKEAFYYLGICYRSGTGVQQNLRTALEYSLKGAELGDVNSMYNVAYSYETGEGVGQSYEKAAEWYLKAANQGNPQAMYNLGLYYDEGKGVEKDYSKAILYFAKASQKNFDKAMYRLAVYYENGIGVDKDIEVAFHFYTEGAKLGNKDCLNSLALYYQNGKCCNADIEKSIHWFEEALKKGNSLAMYNLGALYELGVYVRQDYRLAFDYYLQGSIKGHAKSLFKVGKFYLEGIGVEKNIKEAISSLKKSYELGYSDAAFELGLIYQLGKGVEASLSEANKWFSLAASNNNAQAYINLVSIMDDEILENLNTEEDIMAMPSEPRDEIIVPEITDVIDNLNSITNDNSQIENDDNQSDYGFQNSISLNKISVLASSNSEYISLLEEYKNFTSMLSVNAEEMELKQKDLKSLKKIKASSLSDEDQEKLSDLENSLINLENNRRDILESITVIEKRFRELEQKRMEEERWQAYLKEVDEFFELLKDKLSKNKISLDDYSLENLELEYEYLSKAKELGYEDLDDKIEYIKYLISKANSRLHISRKNDVFICYCKADKIIQDRIHLILEARGIGTIWEMRGTDVVIIDDEILDAIENAKIIIPIISINSLKSELVKNELIHVFDRLDNTVDPKSLIRPVIVEDNNLLSEIKQLDDRNIFKRLFRLAEDMTTSLDYEQIYLDCKNVLDMQMLRDYKNNASLANTNYNYSINKFNCLLDTKNGLISSRVKFKDFYIDRLVYDKKNNEVTIDDLLNGNKDIFIFGSRGIGKSLLLKKIFNDILDDNVFFLSCKNLVDDLECERSFEDILKINSFDIYFDNLKISSDIFSAYLYALGKIVLLIDGLDELKPDNKIYLLSVLGQFMNKNPKIEIKIIYSSTCQEDLDLINKYTKSSVNMYFISPFTNEDVINVFDHINDSFQSNISSNVESSDSVSREFFISSLDNIDLNIKSNPLLISNIIYLYFVERKIYKRKFDILSAVLSLAIYQIHDYSELGYKHSDYVKKDILEKILRNIAFENTIGNSRSNHLLSTVGNLYFSNNINNDDKSIELVVNELKKHNIINNNGINNLMLRNYLAGCYLYNLIFKYDEINNAIIFNDDIKQLKDIYNKYSLNNDELEAILSMFITKLDNEIRKINDTNDMNQNNNSYNTFDSTLTLIIKKKLFDKAAIALIKQMCDNNELYYSEFIKTYF